MNNDTQITTEVLKTHSNQFTSSNGVFQIRSSQKKESWTMWFSMPKIYRHFNLEYPKNMSKELAKSTSSFIGHFVLTTEATEFKQKKDKNYFYFNLYTEGNDLNLKITANNVTHEEGAVVITFNEEAFKYFLESHQKFLYTQILKMPVPLAQNPVHLSLDFWKEF